MPIIRCEGLGKTFRIADTQPGLAGTLRHLLKRRTRDLKAVRHVSFTVEPGKMVASSGPTAPAKPPTSRCSAA
jgi:ABC-2 type transport system ATP-binding protein